MTQAPLCPGSRLGELAHTKPLQQCPKCPERLVGLSKVTQTLQDMPLTACESVGPRPRLSLEELLPFERLQISPTKISFSTTRTVGTKGVCGPDNPQRLAWVWVPSWDHRASLGCTGDKQPGEIRQASGYREAGPGGCREVGWGLALGCHRLPTTRSLERAHGWPGAWSRTPDLRGRLTSPPTPPTHMHRHVVISSHAFRPALGHFPGVVRWPGKLPGPLSEPGAEQRRHSCSFLSCLEQRGALPVWEPPHWGLGSRGGSAGCRLSLDPPSWRCSPPY